MVLDAGLGTGSNGLRQCGAQSMVEQVFPRFALYGAKAPRRTSPGANEVRCQVVAPGLRWQLHDGSLHWRPSLAGQLCTAACLGVLSFRLMSSRHQCCQYRDALYPEQFSSLRSLRPGPADITPCCTHLCLLPSHCHSSGASVITWFRLRLVRRDGAFASPQNPLSGCPLLSMCTDFPDAAGLHGQFARVAKGVDLRSSAGNCAWVRTPQLTSL